MRLTNLLFTKEAKGIYRQLQGTWSEAETQRYAYLIANFCNEMALYHRLERELATAPLVVEYTNNKGKVNDRKHELTRARAESQLLLLRQAHALKLSPKSAGELMGDDAELSAPEL